MPRVLDSGTPSAWPGPHRGDRTRAACQCVARHELSNGTARKGLQPVLGSTVALCALAALTRAPGTLQILVAMNTGGQGRGGDRPSSQAGEEDRWVKSLAHCRALLLHRNKGLRQVLGITPSPCSPGLGAAATVSQQEGPGVTPKQGRGACKCPALPGCLTQCWQRETWPGDGMGDGRLKP